MARALDIALPSAREVVDRARQRLDFARICSAQAFRGVQPKRGKLAFQVRKRLQPELHLNPCSAGKRRPDEQKEQRQDLAELGRRSIEFALVGGDLNENLVLASLRLNDPVEKEELMTEWPVGEMRSPVELVGARRRRQHLIPQ